MKRRRIIWLVILVAVFVVCLWGYRLPSRAGARTRIVVGRDVSDSVSPGSSQAKTGYDPYVARVNAASPYLNATGTVNTPGPSR